MKDIIVCKNVTKIYPLGKTEVRALNDVSFTIAEGEFLSIIGPSGSGKSTILNLIGCLDEPTSGEVIINGKNVSKLSDTEATRIRRRDIGFIFQSFNLIPVLTVFENVELPLALLKINKKEMDSRVNSLLDAVGLGKYSKHRPDELSGGQRQRVAIARALITNPGLVLADEPTANLDSTTGEQIIDLMLELNEKKKTTFVFSTHDYKIVNRAKRKIQICDGKLVN
jgi:putative ABC transport system ATP-binding protein